MDRHHMVGGRKRGRPPIPYARKITSCNLEDDLALAIEKYRELENLPNINDAVKALLRQALAATPRDGALQAAKVRAFTQVRQYVITSAARAMNDIALVLQESLKQEAMDAITAKANAAYGAEPEPVEYDMWGEPVFR